jgi:3-oxoacyl-[acyl-carrier protein] reductase
MPSETQPFTGKIALITGASRGIGAATAHRLATGGATVLVNYGRSAAAAEGVVAQIRKAGGKAELLPGDIGRPEQITALFQTIDRKHGGRIDILVNNAGVYITGPVVELTADDYAKTFDVNVRGVFLASQAAVKRMPEGGRIITIGSIVGGRVPFPGLTLYSASKFAVAGMSRALARELAPRKITSNVVQPGPIDTDMNPADPTKNPAAEFMVKAVPLARYGRAEEVAATVAFLASPEAAYITGAVVNIDGGLDS